MELDTVRLKNVKVKKKSNDKRWTNETSKKILMFKLKFLKFK